MPERLSNALKIVGGAVLLFGGLFLLDEILVVIGDIVGVLTPWDTVHECRDQVC